MRSAASADPDAGLRAMPNVDMGDGERLGLASGGGSEERLRKGVHAEQLFAMNSLLRRSTQKERLACTYVQS